MCGQVRAQRQASAFQSLRVDEAAVPSPYQRRQTPRRCATTPPTSADQAENIKPPLAWLVVDLKRRCGCEERCVASGSLASLRRREGGGRHLTSPFLSTQKANKRTLRTKRPGARRANDASRKRRPRPARPGGRGCGARRHGDKRASAEVEDPRLPEPNPILRRMDSMTTAAETPWTRVFADVTKKRRPPPDRRTTPTPNAAA